MGGVNDPANAMRLLVSMAGSNLGREVFETLYEEDPLARKIVDTPAEDMLREGFEVSGDIEVPEAIDIPATLQKALRWSALHGGSAILIGCNNADRSQPRTDARGPLEFLTVLTCWQLVAHSFYTNPFAPKYLQPEFFTIATEAAGVQLIHESWVIPFLGLPRASEVSSTGRYWGLSVLQPCLEEMGRVGTSAAAAAAMVNQASIGVFSLTGLYDQIASGERETVETRMGYANASKSLWRALILDKEGEDFKFVSPNFTGVTDIMGRLEERLSASCNIPVSLLFGRSAAGLNASNDGDYRTYLGRIKSQQMKHLQPAIRTIYQLLAVDNGVDPKLVEVKFAPLWSPTAAEEAVIEKSHADRDQVYITQGVWTPEEVAISRARGVTSTGATEIDIEAREAAQKASVTFDDPLPAPVVPEQAPEDIPDDV
jgi:hypothetical protein